MPYAFNDNYDESGYVEFEPKNINIGKTDNSEQFFEALGEVRQKLAQQYSAMEISKGGAQIEEDARIIARSIYTSYNTRADERGNIALQMNREEFVERSVAELLSMGPITPMLVEESIEDIAINGPKETYVYRNGGWEYQYGLEFESDERLLEMMNRSISSGNKKVNQVIPIVDATLPGKERVSIVTYPVTDVWPTVVIRAHRSKDIELTDFTKKYQTNDESNKNDFAFSKAKYLKDYTKFDTGGMLTAKAATYLHAAVLTGLNIVVVGPTGCGKTTLLTALGKLIPDGERILIIEDTPEINLHPNADRPHNCVYLRTRAASIDGKLEAVDQADLVKLALRQRPDALTLGEARGKEVFDLLNALNTGHKNGLTSIHAESSREVFGRVYMMLSQSEQGRHLDRYRAANLAANTMNILVTLQMFGSRRSVQSIVEYSGKLINENTSPEPEIVPIFENTGGHDGNLGPMIRNSIFCEKFRSAGMPEFAFTTMPLPGERRI